VLNNLKTRDYPLDSSIEICKIYSLQEPQAFLFMRSGAIEKVLEIYLDIFFEDLKKMKENPEKGSFFTLFVIFCFIRWIEFDQNFKRNHWSFTK